MAIFWGAWKRKCVSDWVIRFMPPQNSRGSSSGKSSDQNSPNFVYKWHNVISYCCIYSGFASSTLLHIHTCPSVLRGFGLFESTCGWDRAPIGRYEPSALHSSPTHSPTPGGSRRTQTPPERWACKEASEGQLEEAALIYLQLQTPAVVAVITNNFLA